ncbi:MAG: nuclear transport factor 2 family protein [Nocardioidaceae bacterium]
MSAELQAVLAANAAFYAAFEAADFDAMAGLWAQDEGVVCVHPGAEPLRGHGLVLRSWLALMANAPYIQFFLTNVEAAVSDDLASVSCTENVLSAGADTPVSVFAGASAVATNVFRRSSDGWRLWVHHASPVLSVAQVDEDDAE